MASALTAQNGSRPRDAQGPKPKKKPSPSDLRRSRRRAARHNAKKLREELVEQIRREDAEHRLGDRDLAGVSTLAERKRHLEQLYREEAQLRWEKQLGWTGEPGYGPRVALQPRPGDPDRPSGTVEIHKPCLAFQGEHEKRTGQA